jgi:hypothetical protein
MKTLLTAAALAIACGSAIAQAQQVTMRDLEGKNPRTLSKDEVTQLLPGATLMRVTDRGNRHQWTNEDGGKFIVSSDNQGSGTPAYAQGRATTAPGKWHVSDDGRYCILIEWRGVPTEDWCRFVIQTSDGHYMTRSTTVGTERAHKFEIKK